jgi:hypothetical protein
MVADRIIRGVTLKFETHEAAAMWIEYRGYIFDMGYTVEHYRPKENYRPNDRRDKTGRWGGGGGGRGRGNSGEPEANGERQPRGGRNGDGQYSKFARGNA